MTNGSKIEPEVITWCAVQKLEFFSAQLIKKIMDALTSRNCSAGEGYDIFIEVSVYCEETDIILDVPRYE